MSEPVHISIPVPETGDNELTAIAQIIWILEQRPYTDRTSLGVFDDAEKRRIVEYLTARYVP